MGVPGNANPLLLRTVTAAATGISRSIRLNSADSAYLSRTPASAGNRKTWTWSGWVKRSKLNNGSGQQAIFSANLDGTDTGYFIAFFHTTDQIYIVNASTNLRITNQVFRDVSAWYHIVVAVDTTTATANNRIRLYVNGVEATFATINNPSQNSDTGINSATEHNIGRIPSGSLYLDAYLAECYLIDGQQLDATSFGETDATTGVWNPKAYTGSYGTNGAHLEFADNSAATATTLGKDTSGNGNHFSPSNFQVIGGGPTSVAAATGALPIYNTTDTYGTTKGTGTRTDSNASYLSLAIALDGTNGGTTFTDESATIKGSGSAKSITVTGNAQTSTAQSKFYGSSGYFDGSGDYISVPVSTDLQVGSGDFTVECWFRTASGSGTIINFGDLIYNASTGYTLFLDSNTLYARTSPDANNDITYSISLNTWYHVAYVRSGNTLTLYVDGLSVGTKTISGSITNSATDFRIGYGSASYQLNGYVQDVRMYKGIAKYTANFNEPTSTAQPSLSAQIDSVVDVPTNGAQTDTGVGGEVRGNYCTLNPLQIGSAITLSNGNLDLSAGSSGSQTAWGTFGVTTGKWYFEFTQTSGTYAQGVGVKYSLIANNSNNYLYTGYDGTKVNASGSSSSYGATWTNNDVIGVALDLDGATITFYKNGTSQGQAFSGITAGTYFPYVVGWSGGTWAATVNFGQRAFAYTAPSGFKALNTASLPAPSVTKPSSVFDITTYVGNGSSKTISGLGFSPDLVWVKQRGPNPNSHSWWDTVRGATKFLYSNGTGAEYTDSVGLTAFNSDGFTAGDDSYGGWINQNGSSFVAWMWDAGSSTVTNTAGSISSQVRANATAGFSVVTWTGNGAIATIGHGLGVQPALIIVKGRNATTDWMINSTSIGATKYIYLNTTGAAVTYSGFWNDTAPTSTVFTTGSDAIFTTGGRTFVAYCFAPVSGYSSFGSYTGNGSTDGPFVYCGFRPKYVVTKRTDSTGNWRVKDSVRDTYNAAQATLYQNTSGAELTEDPYDFLSNGFKIRTSGPENNASGGTYIYIAFAESPFNYSRAR